MYQRKGSEMHSRVAVLIPTEIAESSFDAVEQKVEELLAPYSEHIEVEPYDQRCYCTDDWVAWQENNLRHVPTKPFDPQCEHCNEGISHEKTTANPDGKWDGWYILTGDEGREYVEQILNPNDDYQPIHLVAPEIGWHSADDYDFSGPTGLKNAVIHDVSYTERVRGIINFATTHGYSVVGVGFHY